MSFAFYQLREEMELQQRQQQRQNYDDLCSEKDVIANEIIENIHIDGIDRFTMILMMCEDDDEMNETAVTEEEMRYWWKDNRFLDQLLKVFIAPAGDVSTSGIDQQQQQQQQQQQEGDQSAEKKSEEEEAHKKQLMLFEDRYANQSAYRNTIELFCDILQHEEEMTQLRAELMSKRVVETLLDNLLKNPRALSEGLPFLSLLVEVMFIIPQEIQQQQQQQSNQFNIINEYGGMKRNSPSHRKKSTNGTNTNGALSNEAEVAAVITARIAELVKYLRTPPANESAISFKNATEVLAPPLGPTRLRIIEFILTLFETKIQSIIDELVRCEVLSALVELFFKYENHNFLHSIIEQVYTIVVKDLPEVTPAMTSMFMKNIIKAFNDTEKPIWGKSYMGHIKLLVRLFDEVMDNAAQAEKLDLSQEELESWGKFKEGLRQQDARETFQWGTLNLPDSFGAQHPDEDDDDDNDDDDDEDDDDDDDEDEIEENGQQQEHQEEAEEEQEQQQQTLQNEVNGIDNATVTDAAEEAGDAAAAATATAEPSLDQ